MDPPFVNPSTGEPYSLGTINGDLKALSTQWKRESSRATETHKGRQVAELLEVRRCAWARKVFDLVGNEHDSPDLDKVLKALKQEAELLGLNAPEKREVTGKDGKDLYPDADLSQFTEGELQKMREIHEAAESRSDQGGAGAAESR